MPIRVCVEESSLVLCVTPTGQLMRREVGWAAERARELLNTRPLKAVLVDASQVQKQITLTLSAEMISGFAAAMDTDLPIAYVRPAVWSEDDYRTISELVEVIPEHTQIFTEIAEARRWLREICQAGANQPD